MLPVTLYVYFKYGRAALPTPKSEEQTTKHCHTSQVPAPDQVKDNDASTDATGELANDTSSHCDAHNRDTDLDASATVARADHDEPWSSSNASHSDAEKGHGGMTDCRHHHDAGSRPMWATVLVGVSHCGAGCVLGDLVGEWLVYGTGATINGHDIWVELLVDYAFALLFGIAFQYFSIAPMSGEYGPKTVWRAAKADILSLTSFEVGAFA